MGEGGVKNPEKLLTSFMDGPLAKSYEGCSTCCTKSANFVARNSPFSSCLVIFCIGQPLKNLGFYSITVFSKPSMGIQECQRTKP